MNTFIGKLYGFTNLLPRKEAARGDQHCPATSAELIIEHFQQCGFILALRESLKIIFFLNVAAHLKVIQSLALPRTRDLKKHHPRAVFKYFGNYLARSFSIGTRSAILANHYRYINDHMAEDFINRICEAQIPIGEMSTDTGQYRISLTYPSNGHKEGELSLLLWENSALIFTLSFTIAPGVLLNVPEDQVIYVSRLQGAKTGRQAIRQVAKSLHEIAPPALLLAATQAIAVSLKISSIIGVNADQQVCVGSASSEGDATSVYDDFWVSSGAAKLGCGMFCLRAEAEEKPLSAIKSNHRSRVRRKRQFKKSVMDQVGQEFKGLCLSQPGAYNRELPVLPSALINTGVAVALAASPAWALLRPVAASHHFVLEQPAFDGAIEQRRAA